jgi:hypothetical protein
MPESAVREELEALGIKVQGVMQLRSGRRAQAGQEERPATPHFVVTVPRGPEVARIRSLTELCGLRVTVETFVAPKDPLQCRRCQRFGHTQRNCGYAPRCVACGESHLSGECSKPQEQLKCCSCCGNHTANYRGCVKWKEARAALVRKASSTSPRPVARTKQPKTRPSKPAISAEQKSLGDGWNHVVRGGRTVKSQPTPTTTATKPAEKQPNKVAPPKKVQPAKAAPKTPKPLKKASEPKKQATKPSEAKVAKPTQPQHQPSPLEEIADLLDFLSLDQYLQLSRRLLKAVHSLPTGIDRSRAILKVIILFVAEDGSAP